VNDDRRYLFWSVDEDQRLKKEFEEGKTVAEMQILHGRSLGAIKSRLLHLGLVMPTRKHAVR